MRPGAIVQLLRPITIKTNSGRAVFHADKGRKARPETPVRALILPVTADNPKGLREALLRALAELDANEKPEKPAFDEPCAHTYGSVESGFGPVCARCGVVLVPATPAELDAKQRAAGVESV